MQEVVAAQREAALALAGELEARTAEAARAAELEALVQHNAAQVRWAGDKADAAAVQLAALQQALSAERESRIQAEQRAAAVKQRLAKGSSTIQRLVGELELANVRKAYSQAVATAAATAGPSGPQQLAGMALLQRLAEQWIVWLHEASEIAGVAAQEQREADAAHLAASRQKLAEEQQRCSERELQLTQSNMRLEAEQERRAAVESDLAAAVALHRHQEQPPPLASSSSSSSSSSSADGRSITEAQLMAALNRAMEVRRPLGALLLAQEVELRHLHSRDAEAWAAAVVKESDPFIGGGVGSALLGVQERCTALEVAASKAPEREAGYKEQLAEAQVEAAQAAASLEYANQERDSTALELAKARALLGAAQSERGILVRQVREERMSRAQAAVDAASSASASTAGAASQHEAWLQQAQQAEGTSSIRIASLERDLRKHTRAVAEAEEQIKALSIQLEAATARETTLQQALKQSEDEVVKVEATAAAATAAAAASQVAMDAARAAAAAAAASSAAAAATATSTPASAERRQPVPAAAALEGEWRAALQELYNTIQAAHATAHNTPTSSSGSGDDDDAVLVRGRQSAPAAASSPVPPNLHHQLTQALALMSRLTAMVDARDSEISMLQGRLAEAQQIAASGTAPHQTSVYDPSAVVAVQQKLAELEGVMMDTTAKLSTVEEHGRTAARKPLRRVRPSRIAVTAVEAGGDVDGAKMQARHSLSPRSLGRQQQRLLQRALQQQVKQQAVEHARRLEAMEQRLLVLREEKREIEADASAQVSALTHELVQARTALFAAREEADALAASQLVAALASHTTPVAGDTTPVGVDPVALVTSLLREFTAATQLSHELKAARGKVATLLSALAATHAASASAQCQVAELWGLVAQRPWSRPALAQVVRLKEMRREAAQLMERRSVSSKVWSTEPGGTTAAGPASFWATALAQGQQGGQQGGQQQQQGECVCDDERTHYTRTLVSRVMTGWEGEEACRAKIEVRGFDERGGRGRAHSLRVVLWLYALDNPTVNTHPLPICKTTRAGGQGEGWEAHGLTRRPSGAPACAPMHCPRTRQVAD